MDKNILALKLGTYILDTIESYKANKGDNLVIPFKIQDDLDWIYSIKLQTPMYSYYDGHQFNHITMSEYFKWDDKNKDLK